MNNSWYAMLKEAMEKDGEDFENRECTMETFDLKRRFDDDYGVTEGEPFTAWGEKWVYFPVVYDGAEWIGHAPRHPCDIATEHQGGG